MTKYLKSVISFFIVLFILPESYSQQPANYPGFLAEKFTQYCKTVPREEIYVHTDRDDYIAGEDLFCNIYLIDRQSGKPSGNSRIAYFEVLNSENLPVVQKRILLEKGFGPGQIVLPDSLSNGIYTIRVYTNWMKNFLPYNCFLKDITIYNALSSNTLSAWSDNKNIINKRIVPGINSEIADAGLVLKVNNLKTDTLDIFISDTKNYRSSYGNLFYLFIQTHGIINHISTERTTGANTIITIPKKELIPGINQITVFDSKGQPICERFIYTPEKKQEYLTLKSSDSFRTREKITLEIESAGVLSAILNGANLSVSVSYNTDNTEMMDLNEYMIFGSEFGILPLSSFTNTGINNITAGLTDSILSTVKSNWIDWKAILSDNPPSFRYRIEKEYHYLSGVLINSTTLVPEPGKILFLSIPGKVASFQYAKTDYKGNFSFNIQIGEGVKDIIIQPEEIENSAIKIESSFPEKYPEKEIVNNISKINGSKYISQLKINYQVSKIYGSSVPGSPSSQSVVPSNLIRFYGKPDIELFMSDYVNLPVMQEVFYELLPGVFLKSRKSGYDISIADRLNNEIFDKKPLLLVDGVIINDASIIANLDPGIVEKIDVVKEKYFVGNYSFSGILNVITKKGDFSCTTLPDYAVRMPYRVTDQILSFVSPDFTKGEMKNSRIPDFRNTLYWNPSVKTDKDGKVGIEFWSSDIASEYKLIIEGVTPEGKTVCLKKIIDVKKF